MKKITSLLILLFFSSNILSAQEIEKETLLFESGKYELTNDSKQRLQKIKSNLADKNTYQLTVLGYADSTGNPEANQRLSKNRALTAAEPLLAAGFHKRQIKTLFYGAQNPVASNATTEGRQKNRRVEIIIEKVSTAKSKLFTYFDKKTQSFSVDGSKEIKIVGKEGTRITIPKNSLVKENGELATGQIEIELKEFYKKSDFVSSNLHTMSDSSLLETAGMINLVAKLSGEDLKLKDGALIGIEMASQADMNGMQTFNGIRHGDQINWLQSSQMNLITTSLTGSATELSFALDSISRKQFQKINKLIIQSARLGWINCDRFSQIQSKTKLTLKIDTSYNPIVFLVFKDINSIMPGNYQSTNDFTLNNIPLGKKATIIAFGFANGKQYFFSKEIIIRLNQIENIQLTASSFDKIEQELVKLN